MVGTLRRADIPEPTKNRRAYGRFPAILETGWHWIPGDLDDTRTNPGGMVPSGRHGTEG